MKRDEPAGLEMVTGTLYLAILGEMWARDGVATCPQLLAATRKVGFSATRSNINTVLARLAEYGCVRPIDAPRSGPGKGSGKPGRVPTYWVAEITKAEFFATSVRHALGLFARVGGVEVDPEALELLKAELEQLPHA